MPCDFTHETALRLSGVEIIAGIDEAGRGPLAGPVVAAAIVLPPSFRHASLNDSKQLTERQRERIFEELLAAPAVKWAVSVVEAAEIDRLNILRASQEAMRRAFLALPDLPHHALIDGLPVRPFPCEHTALVKGDGRSLSIAAASVIAKVTRDRLMIEADAQFPHYGFAKHKGYGTPFHLEKLKLHGPCPLHRRSFSPVAQCHFSF
jgi:ribonuclease HII